MSLQSLANQHRAAILAREHATGAHLAAAFNASWSRIWASVSTTSELKPQLATVGSEISGFAQYASVVVKAQAQMGAHLGQQDAHALLSSHMRPILLTPSAPPQATQQALQQSLDHGWLAQRFSQLAPDAVLRAKKTLLLGQMLGWNPRRIAAQLRHDLAIELNDALRIARTESMQAYRAGALANYQANADVLNGWIWSAAAGACPACAAMDGTHHDLSEDFNAIHPNDRCAPIPDVKSYDVILSQLAA